MLPVFPPPKMRPRSEVMGRVSAPQRRLLGDLLASLGVQSDDLRELEHLTVTDLRPIPVPSGRPQSPSNMGTLQRPTLGPRAAASHSFSPWGSAKGSLGNILNVAGRGPQQPLGESGVAVSCPLGLTRPRCGACLGHWAHRPQTLDTGAELTWAHTPCVSHHARVLECNLHLSEGPATGAELTKPSSRGCWWGGTRTGGVAVNTGGAQSTGSAVCPSNHYPVSEIYRVET